MKLYLPKYIARKSRIVTAKEFDGNGKILVFNKSKVNPNANGKFGPVIEYTVKELSLVLGNYHGFQCKH
jgi:hypothetical protein